MTKLFKQNIKKNTQVLGITVGCGCNNFCVFCMRTDRAERFKKIKNFLENRIYHVLEDNTDKEKVIFTGGEPTLNPLLIDYVRRAKQLGYKRIEIMSNGRMFRYKDYCAKLIEAGANEFIVSIHGHNKATHEAISRSPDSFDQTSEGLANLTWFKKNQPIKLSINHILVEDNFRFIGDFLRFLKIFNLDNVVLKVVSNLRESTGEGSNYGFLPRYREVVRVLEKLYKGERNLFLSRFKPKSNYVYVYDLPVCCYQNIRSFLGAREDTFLETDDKMIPINHSRNKIQGEICRPCKYRAVCSGIYKGYIAKYGWSEFMPVKK